MNTTTNIESVAIAQVLDKMAQQRDQELVQRRREQRWRNFWNGTMLFGVTAVVASYAYVASFLQPASDDVPSDGYAAVVQLSGIIDPSAPASAANVVNGLKKAFKDPRAKGVLLYVNSPGGSPVQANIIHQSILSLKAKYPGKKIVTVATDTLASAAYWVASATDEIYTDASTTTGSIGVVIEGFGFPDALTKFGVERRVFTAGAHKVRMDPFSPVKAEDRTKVENVLTEVHKNFTAAVTKSRGTRLKASAENLFSGDFWTGSQALELGLIDGLGDWNTVVKKEWGVESLRDYTIKPSLFDKFSRFSAVLENPLAEMTMQPRAILY